MTLQAFTDPMLVTLAQNGDRRAEDELLRRYERVVRHEALAYQIPGATVDDAEQECRIGLLKAIRGYDPARLVTFKTYALLSIRRQLITALKSATRLKHRSLSLALREAVNDEGESIPIVELLPLADSDPVDVLTQRAELRRVARALRVLLSPAEARVTILWTNGYSYPEIAAHERITTKQVDVRLTRARWKLTGEGPPSAPERDAAPLESRRVYVCPGCGLETVRVTAGGHERRGPGRPPRCNVCKAAKAA